ncbi:hypothetical protein HMI55_003275 [Coelomomyces lativittatus]|nr:hypothetical protein HMI55_003275 [Coelomomyces lativittatus]
MELTSIYPTLLENEEKATMIYWASTWLEYRFHSDPGWACSILEAMLSLQENIDIVGTMFQDLPFIVDLTKAFSATETFSELKESLDPLFQSTYEKLKNMASNIFWPPPTFMSVPDIKEENFMEDVVSPIGPKFEKAMTLEPLDPIIKQKVLSYMYNDDVDEDEDEDLEESENTSHVSCPMTLIEAYSKDPSVFQRTAKDSLERDRLRKATGLNDHQIEGWGSYLRRNPKKMRSVVSGFSGHQQHLPSTRYRSNG